MTLAIMQPYFFPYLGYFQLIAAVDKFVIYDDVNYIKRGWINRNRILLNGKAHFVTVPVLAASQNELICNLSVDPSTKWRDKLLLSIKHAYTKAPYYNQVMPIVERCLFYRETNLSKFILYSLQQVVTYLGLKTVIVASSSIYNNRKLNGAERILDICAQEQAKTYINPMGGKHLYQLNEFEEKGIDLQFIEPKSYEYSQGIDSFTPHLSFIDLLMNNTVEEVIILLNQHKLI